jgi:hypothetical protein
MKTKRFVTGLNNSQKIRVIVDGVGFVTTVAGVFDMPIRTQRVATSMALNSLGLSQGGVVAITGIARTYDLYDHDGKPVNVNVQVDFV